jgi:single-strand DNA-binding protein
MISSTQITIVGRLGSDPELRFTPTGLAAASLSVAVSQRKYNRDSSKWEDTGTTWYRVNLWRDMAQHAADSLKRGMSVIVIGSLAARDWESNGKSGTAWEITADAIGPDLTFATAEVRRTTRDSVPPPDDPWSANDASEPADSAA